MCYDINPVMKLQTNLDHLVIGAATLQQGIDYIGETLGVRMPPGGEHPRMGTHNHLMQLGEGAFLEIIAINPGIPAPSRPRWFGLDDPYVKTALIQQPRLLTWVVNTNDIKQIHGQSAVPLGTIEPMSRNDLEWLITIPEDGSLLGSGLIPTVIQWHTDIHPSTRMSEFGCSLSRLKLYHSNVQWLENVLNAIEVAGHVEIHPLPDNESPHMVAQIQTPSGEKELSGRL